MTDAKTYDIVHPETGQRFKIKEPRVLMHSMEDEDKPTKCVEFTVIGVRGEWTNWAFYNDFVKINPEVKIQDAA